MNGSDNHNNVLEVGLSADESEVVINLPFCPDDGTGWTHVTFSPEQARGLARLLSQKADDAHAR